MLKIRIICCDLKPNRDVIGRETQFLAGFDKEDEREDTEGKITRTSVSALI